jgi:catechol 2,3-dioxygenase-like lactoylglutathione lyase family enzyme
MNHCFDHAMISVRDLNEAIAGYRALGFDVHFAFQYPRAGRERIWLLLPQRESIPTKPKTVKCKGRYSSPLSLSLDAQKPPQQPLRYRSS